MNAKHECPECGDETKLPITLQPDCLQCATARFSDGRCSCWRCRRCKGELSLSLNPPRCESICCL